MASVLIVDDDLSALSDISTGLGELGHVVTTAHDGISSLAALGRGVSIEIALVDARMPEMDGFDVCRRFRENSSMPVIMLIHPADTADAAVGLACGAEDYLLKPADAQRAHSRISAALAKVRPDICERILSVTASFGHVRVDRRAMRATKAGRALDLTPIEFRLLMEFANHPGQAMTRRSLLESVWRYDSAGDPRIVDACVRRLREKIEDDPPQPQFVSTIAGVGYRLEA